MAFANHRQQDGIPDNNAFSGSEVRQDVRYAARIVRKKPPDIVLIGIVRESERMEVVALFEDCFGHF